MFIAYKGKSRMCGKRFKKESCRCGPEGRRGYRFLEPYILLKLKEKPSYGYQLIEALKDQIVHGEPDPGAVYRTLRLLEEEGFVTSTWETNSEGPARRYYNLTPSGEDLLESWVTAIKARRDALDKFLTKYQNLKKGGD